VNIVVCIKQVPDTTKIRIDPETNTLVRTGVKSIVNPLDRFAIEEGVRLREQLGGKVIVMTMGPSQAEQALREAIEVGADEPVLLTDRKFAGSDTWATSYVLSKAIEKIGDYSLIICGVQAIDGDTGQVGPGLSAHLDIPQITYVKKILEISGRGPESDRPDQDGAYIRAERMTEEGYETVQSPLPALITVVKDINEPRLPSLKGKLRAKKAEITNWGADDLEIDPDLVGIRGSPTRVVKVTTPPPRARGQLLKGESREVCNTLVEILRKDLTQVSS
jgi:electron transfer flavoprotein beta subunit